MKGFTLIELLAVIVILAILLLIAMPIIGNIIDGSKKSAFESSVYGLVEGTKFQLMKASLGGTNADMAVVIKDGLITTGELEYRGELPENGTIYVKNDERVAFAMHNGKYCMEKGYGTEATTTEKELADCVVPVGPPIVSFTVNGGIGNPIETAANVVAMDNPISTIEYKWTDTTDIPVNGYTTYTNGETLSMTTVGLFYLHIRVTDSENNITNTVSNLFDIVVPGPEPLTTVVPDGFTPIYKIEDLLSITHSEKYILMSNIDFNEDACYSNISNKTALTTGVGWNPKTPPMIFDGNGLEIRNLYINRSNVYTIGFFKTLSSNKTIKNLTIKNATVTSNRSEVGVLLGSASGDDMLIERVSIENSTVTGAYGKVGGMIGIVNTSSSSNWDLRIKESYVRDSTVLNNGGSSWDYVGGMVGWIKSIGNNVYITDSYVSETTVDASGENVGGLAGYSDSDFNTTRNYISASINGGTVYTGAVYGWCVSEGNYYDKDAFSFNYGTANAWKKTTTEMYQQATFTGWDFTNIWKIDEGNDYPRLRWER